MKAIKLKKMCIKLAFLFLLFFCIVIDSNLNAQQGNTSQIIKRIEILEESKSNFEGRYQLYAEKLKNEVDQRIEDKTAELNDANKTLKYILFLGVPATLLSIIGAYYLAINTAKKFVIKKIEDIVEHKREEIIRLIETQEFDTRLKKTKKLLVLSPDEESQNKIKPFFVKVKFQHVIYRVVTTHAELPEHDLIIFNDFSSPFEQNIIDIYLNNAEEDEVSFVAFTQRQLRRDNRMNFSNSKFTLYHSILSTLKYAEILKLTA